jgi:hypothetical protein
MSNAADTRKPASFWRTISKEDALAARSAIETFFGAAQLQVQSPKEAAPVVHPQGARWVIGAGLALCAAAACTMLLRPLLPASIPDIRGLYIGLAGIVAHAAGIASWLIETKRQDPPKPPVVVLEEEARTWIGKQVDHAEAYTMSLFGRAQAGAHRVQLQGIGKEWASAIGIRSTRNPTEPHLAPTAPRGIDLARRIAIGRWANDDDDDAKNGACISRRGRWSGDRR